MIDGLPMSRDTFQARLAEFNVEAKPAYGATLANPDGSYGGSEEHYAAVHKKTGALYGYTITHATDGHKYHSLRRSEAPAQPAPQPGAADARFESYAINGEEVNKATFEARLATLKVDAEPWINGHMTNSEGESGGSATYEATDPRSGQRWTYKVVSIGKHSERSLSLGSTKQGRERIQ
ncbi:MAG: hypothetical protein MUF64_26140 [Polyangiaceae bacterium]|jgi:hypothetical protein|nr:hypothetical protein [Polyangiaceae bacterium]